MNSEQYCLESSDIYLLSAVLAVVDGAILDECIDRSDPKHVSFKVYGEKEKIAEAKSKWWDNKLEGNLREYMLQLKRIKSLVHGGN